MRALSTKACRIVPGTSYGAPKEVWGFRARAGRGSPERVALAFLEKNEALLGLRRVRLGPARVLESLGASHVIFQQVHRGHRVNRAYATVHIGTNRGIYLAKCRIVPEAELPPAFEARVDPEQAARIAQRAVSATPERVRVHRWERLWFWARDKLVPAYRVRLSRERPRREWIVHLDAKTGRLLERRDNLARAVGRAWVFDPSPVAAVRDFRSLFDGRGRVRRPPERTYVEVELQDLDGSGYLDGKRVTTRPTSGRAFRADLDFRCRAGNPGFAESMAYYHVDCALRHVESMGYEGARAIFQAPISADVRASGEDNSWYSAEEKRICFGTGDVDDAEDGDTILHELGHALQDAICPDFGASPQAAAMGEGFSDYLAATFFAEKKPRSLCAAVMLWDGILSNGRGGAPGVRRLDEPLTFESFEHHRTADEHDNGRIWSAVLWDIRAALGRDIADRIIVESHFQLDGFTTFARGARAILDADDNLQAGIHKEELVRVFHRRGVAPVV